MSPRKVVVVGAGHAGGTFVALLRREGFDGEITMVGTEVNAPYHRPPLSKSFGGGRGGENRGAPAKWLYDPAFYQEQGIDLRLSETVTSVDRGGRSVTLRGGAVLDYDVLVLATGAEPRRLGLPGEGLEGIHTLRDVGDAVRLDEAITSGRPLAIVGGGYIGLEVAAAARAHGVDVTVIEREDRLLARVASPALSGLLSEHHRASGTAILTGAQTVGYVCDAGRVGGVRLADDTVIPCGTVLVGAGAVPRQALAEQAGLECGNGVMVDARCRTSDESILAIGDVTNRPVDGLEIMDGRMRVESIPSAVDQARHAVDVVLGRPAQDHEVPWFWSDQFDLRIKIAGIVHGDYETVQRGDPAAGSFALYHLRSGRLVAVETVNAPKDFMVSKRMLSTGCPVDAEALRDPEADLKLLLAAA
ncbi:NAD(P)/FAD-dependent oxidoreductase [Citricoccus sp. K5]|uniref:NAD(P)/FAD-dependent oxidoreductase n=1 Tax=Citricoccus sp. K5 TaxID=2653135 RepID=UPI0012EF88EC|nr:FAD-dependent oxidoreductase [Citricoccus sp. K5]VXA90272.1 Chloroacetanilide N-alkylformylase, ferredoxin reductase component [Citricoccus sp. K5]